MCDLQMQRISMNTIIANEKIDDVKLAQARKIISGLYREMPEYIARGHGPFLAAIYDENGNQIAKAANSVITDQCSNHHAEINAIYDAEKTLKTYDLSAHNLSLYITAEPCMMCVGAIMWSGIRAVYFGVPSNRVESITGFDEGFKQDWLNEFKQRGITVYGNIESDSGEKILRDYIAKKHTVYSPLRKPTKK